MKQYYAMLDSMRGVAAIGVVLLHLHTLTAPFGIAHGYLAVDFFFALSGLVISQAYASRLQAGLSLPHFVVLRIKRLSPLYLLGTALGAGVYLLPAILHPGRAIPAGLGLSLMTGLFMLPSPALLAAKPWLMPLNVAAWSLLGEMIVNIVYAAIARRLTGQVLGTVIALSGCTLAAAAWHAGTLDLGATWPTAISGLIRTLFSFSVGVAIGRMIAGSAIRRTIWALAMPLTLCAALAVGEVPVWYDLLCVFGLFPALLIIGARWETPYAAPLRFLGAISYPLYALHGPLLSLIAGPIAKLGLQSPAMRVALAVVVLACLLAIASLADRFFDQPLRRWLAGKRRVALAAEPFPRPSHDLAAQEIRS